MNDNITCKIRHENNNNANKFQVIHAECEINRTYAKNTNNSRVFSAEMCSARCYANPHGREFMKFTFGSSAGFAALWMPDGVQEQDAQEMLVDRRRCVVLIVCHSHSSAASIMFASRG